jgi:hypothetical protein
MCCGWDVKWLAFTKERHGASFQSKRLGIDKEMKVFRVEFNAQLYYYLTKYRAYYGQFLNQI